MQRNMKKMVLVLGSLVIFAVPAMATDYSAMSTDELNAMRGTLQGVSEQERAAFRAEWQKRVSDMTPEELEQNLSQQKGQRKGAGQNIRQNRGKGMGKGKGRGGGRGPSAN